jgi:hypothetical protein
MSRRDSEEEIEFQVPTPSGLVTVIVPMMSAVDAAVAAARVAGVIRAMFAVVDDQAPHINERDREP